MADGAYDRAATYDAILARNPFARFIAPPCKGAVPGPTATISPTQRDLHILAVDEHGRMNLAEGVGLQQALKGRGRHKPLQACHRRHPEIPS
jgi:hypothetical protein